jgi:hypothetical protein
MSGPLASVRSALVSLTMGIWEAFLHAARTAMMAEEAKPYRPEAYYMRGPGPKWREKQAQARNSAPR